MLFTSVAIGMSNNYSGFGFGFTTLNWKPLCTNYVRNKQIRVELNRDAVNYSKINCCNLCMFV